MRVKFLSKFKAALRSCICYLNRGENTPQDASFVIFITGSRTCSKMEAQLGTHGYFSLAKSILNSTCTHISLIHNTITVKAASKWQRETLGAHLCSSFLRTPTATSCLQNPETHLLMIRAQHDPATEGVAQVNHAGAAAEAQDFGKGDSHGQN